MNIFGDERDFIEATSRPVAPVLDSRLMQQQPVGALSQPKYGWKDALLDIGLPVLGTLATGGFGAPALLAAGIGNAAERYKLSKDPLQNALYNAGVADADIKSMEADYFRRNPDAFEQEMVGRRNASVPSSVRVVEFLESKGFKYGTPEFNEAYTRLQAPGGVYGSPLAYGQDVVIPSRVPGVPNMSLPNQGRLSPENIALRAQEAGQTGFASASGQVQGQTTPDNIARQVELASAKTAGETQVASNEAIYSANLKLHTDLRSTVSQLVRIRDKIENGPETSVASEWVEWISPELQALNAQIAQGVRVSLANVRATAGAQGNLNEKEFANIMNLGAKLSNTKQANLAILDELIDSATDQMGFARENMRKVPDRGRPAIPDAPKRKSGKDYLSAH